MAPQQSVTDATSFIIIRKAESKFKLVASKPRLYGQHQDSTNAGESQARYSNWAFVVAWAGSFGDSARPRATQLVKSLRKRRKRRERQVCSARCVMERVQRDGLCVEPGRNVTMSPSAEHDGVCMFEFLVTHAHCQGQLHPIARALPRRERFRQCAVGLRPVGLLDRRQRRGAEEFEAVLAASAMLPSG